jgi:hypothetical protein
MSVVCMFSGVSWLSESMESENNRLHFETDPSQTCYDRQNDGFPSGLAHTQVEQALPGSFHTTLKSRHHASGHFSSLNCVVCA